MRLAITSSDERRPLGALFISCISSRLHVGRERDPPSYRSRFKHGGMGLDSFITRRTVSLISRTFMTRHGMVQTFGTFLTFVEWGDHGSISIGPQKLNALIVFSSCDAAARDDGAVVSTSAVLPLTLALLQLFMPAFYALQIVEATLLFTSNVVDAPRSLLLLLL